MTEVGVSRQEREFANKLKAAVVANNAKIVRRLVKGGVNVNKNFWYDGTLLHESVLSGSTEITQLLIEANADVNAQNKDGRTALHLAARSGNEEIVRSLLKAGAKVDLLSKDRRSCLHVAVWKGHVGVVHQLTSSGAYVNRADMDGWTPIFWAVRNKSLLLVKYLVDQGAQLCTETKNGENLLTVAFLAGDQEIANYLVKQGAELFMLQKLIKESDLAVSPKRWPNNSNIFHNLMHPDSELISLLLQDISHTRKEIRGKQLSAKCLEKINTLQKSVGSLATYCRRTIRSCVWVSCDGRALSNFIHKLPVPEHLKDFLLYDDVLKYDG